jgi:TonB family protein
MELGKQWQGQLVDGRFPLEQYLGGSDEHAVFLTRISGGATKAVIKLVLAGASDPDAQLAAWRRAAKLSHPNLIRIFDGGRCWLNGSDLIFVVTEFADENLAQVVPQRALTTEEADATFRPAVEALAYVHSQGLVHGRIRPSNVLAVSEHIKLSSDSIQAPGTALRKSPATVYDSPEAARFQLSPAADAWSLGATLAEALTQRVPRKLEPKNENTAKLQQPFADIVSHTMIDDLAARSTIADIQARLAGKKAALAAKTAATANVATRAPAKPAPAVARQTQSQAEKSRLPFVAAIVVAAIVAIAFFLMRGGGPKPSAGQGQSATASPTPAESTQSASPANTAPSTAHSGASGDVVNRVLPTPSRSALNTIHGTIKVRIRVKVDASGAVSHAGFVTSGPSQYFSRLAMQAAQQWKFAPASSASESTVVFAFNRRGVDASILPSRSR